MLWNTLRSTICWDLYMFSIDRCESYYNAAYRLTRVIWGLSKPRKPWYCLIPCHGMANDVFIKLNLKFPWTPPDDIIKWKHFPFYCPFVRGINRSPVNSSLKGQLRGALMFSLIFAWTNGRVNNRHAGDYDATVMIRFQHLIHLVQHCYAIQVKSVVRHHCLLHSPWFLVMRLHRQFVQYGERDFARSWKISQGNSCFRGIALTLKPNGLKYVQ